MLRLRVPLTLVAAFVLIALVVGVLIGSRLIHDWSSFYNPAPAGGGPQSSLAQLEARPLNLPSLKSGDPCPESPPSTRGYNFGTGPVWVNGGPEIQTQWGYYFDVTYFTASDLSGPVLVRGRDLMSNRTVVFVGDYSSGAVVGIDTLAGSQIDQRAEIVFDAAHPRQRAAGGYGFFQVRQGLSRGWAGCFGFQIDGPNFTETITGFAAP